MSNRNVRNLMNQQLEAPMSRHRRPSRGRSTRGGLAAGVVALGLSMSAAPAGAVEAPAAVPAADTPPRVTGFSNFFDYCATGSTLAVPLFYGIGTSTLNFALAQFPAEAQPVTNQILVAEAAGPQLFEAMAPGAKQFLDAGRAGVAPLAAYNEQFNSGLTALSGGTRTAAEALGPVVQPADVSMYQFADFLDSIQAR
ncbi:MAG TPA: hypothetical protein VM347_31780 [Nonomuraea sp.]|nr:hypothetical protein [Nonomuraea sp.]